MHSLEHEREAHMILEHEQTVDIAIRALNTF